MIYFSDVKSPALYGKGTFLKSWIIFASEKEKITYLFKGTFLTLQVLKITLTSNNKELRKKRLD